jgi:hypothetical protein
MTMRTSALDREGMPASYRFLLRRLAANRLSRRTLSVAAKGDRGKGEGMKTLRTLKVVFTGVGAALLIGAIFWALHTRSFVAQASLAEGTVIRLIEVSSSSGSPTYKPVVSFTAADGRERQFASRVSSNPPSYRPGEKVSVLYAVTDPGNAAINGFLALWFGPLLVGGIGAVLFSIGAGVILVPRLLAQRAARIRASGTPIQAKVIGVERNTAIAVGGTNPWRIAAQWQDPATGEMHVFHSENLWYDPSDQLKREAVTVYLDGGNPKRYAMDASFLPKLAG